MEFVRSPPGGLALVLAGLAAYGALVAWARRPGRGERWPMLAAATALAVAGANVLAPALGWWRGHWSYALPPPLRVGFWALWITPWATLLLGGYRWLGAHARRPRAVYALLGLVVLAPFTVIADAWALRVGYLSFGGGYALWHDVLAGQACFWLPVLLYEVARRRWRSPAGGRATRGGRA
ncbi:MAG TPA: hypothetical protein VFL91_24070 [Thermomicrobiales bacterium]|nr:hypothetical protein [Thermomicrobiales bacterium]